MIPVAIETIWGRDDGKSSPYLTRVSLGDRLCIHVFHRGDADPDPHDHLRGFVTFPFVSYVEEVYRHGHEGRHAWRIVRAWRPHWRGRTFIHRVLGAWSGERDRLTGEPVPSVTDKPFASLVWWWGRKRETWGFWVYPGRGLRVRRQFMPWRAYCYGEGAE